MTPTTDPVDDDPDALPVPPADGPGLFGTPAPEATTATPAAVPAPGPAAPYRVLARKYRPVGFDDVIGQDAMVRVLRRAFETGRVAHAFMLTGVRGVGKTTTARILARALNCVGPDGRGGPTADPCGVCANCVAILADRHPDVIEMDAASRTGVDDIREVIESTRFRPMQARSKVFVIDEVHMLSRNAFNALLKTLEEPPAHVTFVFATTELRKVPVTVLSRCQRFDLRRVREGELAALFARIAGAEGVAVEAEALALIARAADGSVRDGLSLLDQAIAQGPRGAAGAGGEDGADGARGDAIGAAAVADMLGLADREAVFALLEAAMAGRVADALAALDAAVDRGADPGLVLTDLLGLVHTVTRIRSVPSLARGEALTELERTRGAALAERLTVASLARAWQMLLKGIAETEQAPDRRAGAEMTLIRLCHVSELPTPGELVRRLADPSAPRPGSAPADPAPRPAPAPAGAVEAGPAPFPRGRGAGGVATALAAAPLPEPLPERPALAAAQLPEPPPAPPPPPRDWHGLVTMIGESGREPLLHAHLRHAVHPVRVGPGRLEIRVEPEGTPPDLAARLGRVLGALTGIRWTVALSRAEGEPTLEAQGLARQARDDRDALAHPLVAEILRHFPDARVGAVRDPGLDRYGLPRAGAAAAEPGFGGAGGGTPAPDAEGDILPFDPEDEAVDDGVAADALDDLAARCGPGA